MFKSVFTSIACLTVLAYPIVSSPVAVSTSGLSSDFGPSTQTELIRFQIERNFALHHSFSRRELIGVVSRAISGANPHSVDLSREKANALSRSVVKVSECYGIDPVIFAALIWRESNFKPKARSETGAAGLTQLTRLGIKEVLERLSPTSHRRFGHLRALVKECNPTVYEKIPHAVSADTLAAWKNSSRHDTLVSLVTGALLLKLNLASHIQPVEKVRSYEMALEKYNGDPKAKVQFARDVLLLAKRMSNLPDFEFALNESKFLSLIRGL